jgi:hypothetical protein
MTARSGWQVVRRERTRLEARFDYGTPELLAAFPFPHELEIDVELNGGLAVTTAVTPAGERAVMTAPTNALVAGGYTLVRPEERFAATFSMGNR